MLCTQLHTGIAYFKTCCLQNNKVNAYLNNKTSLLNYHKMGNFDFNVCCDTIRCNDSVCKTLADRNCSIEMMQSILTSCIHDDDDSNKERF